MADLLSYIEASDHAGKDYLDSSGWATKAILNVARVSGFSSDRTVREYARDIWGIKSSLSTPEDMPLGSKEPTGAEVSR
jgi:starch phosphorylase